MVLITFNYIIFLRCRQSKSLLIISVENGGSKAPIRLSWRGRPFLVEMQNLKCLGMAMKENFLVCSTHFIFLIRGLVPGNVVIIFSNMCVQNESYHGGMDIWNYMKRHVNFFVFVYLFICFLV